VDTDTLATLPPRELQSGLYEVVKYGLIYDRQFCDYLDEHLAEMLERKPEIVESVISRCCEIKAEVTSIDESEADLRRILNFGHTFGHALEAAMGYCGITHGEAVGYGMIAAVLLSEHKGYLGRSTAEALTRLICRIGPLPTVRSVSVDAILEAMARDKKRQHDQIHFVLLKEVGKTSVEAELDESVLRSVWQRITSRA